IYSNENNYFLGFTANNISKFTYDSQTTVEEPTLKESVVSPNPTNGLVNLQLPCLNEPSSYSIIDMSGSKLEQKVISNSRNELHLDLSSFPVGVYYLIIECRNEVNTYKIIKE
ncbi:MAG: T9SS type A sorting domain-containing protein, partial [Candidatus Kapaibacterium sp.]